MGVGWLCRCVFHTLVWVGVVVVCMGDTAVLAIGGVLSLHGGGLDGGSMLPRGHFTYQELLGQPAAWDETLGVLMAHADVLGALLREGCYTSVVFTGCGSIYYLALAAAALFQEFTGVPARGVPASEVWLMPGVVLPRGGRVLLVAMSRSGANSETLHACESFRAGGVGDVLTLSCYPEQPLTRLGVVNLVFPAGQEQSVAQTRAFSCLYLATMAFAALWAGRDDVLGELVRLRMAGQYVLTENDDRARAIGRDSQIDRCYFLGSGSRYGLACELSLKWKEMALSHSEAFHFLEFRHGPQVMVTPTTLIMGLVSQAHRVHEVAVLDELRVRGARILAVGEQAADVTFASGLTEPVTDVLYLPIGQLIAFERAMQRGLDPDRPHGVTAAVTLDVPPPRSG